MRPPASLIALSLASSLAGCASITSMTTASTLEMGRTQLSLEPQVLTAVTVGQPQSGSPTPFPAGSLTLRYGVADNLEVGGRIGNWTGLEALAKLRLTERGAPVVLSVAPTLGGLGDEQSAFVHGSLALLVGLPSGGNELVIAPKLDLETAFGTSDLIDFPLLIGSVGASIGYAIRLGRLTVLPEVGARYPLFGASADSASLMASQGLFVQGSLAVALTF